MCPRQVPLLCTQKHRTLPVRLRQAPFVLLKAQNAARLLGAAHPGPRLDFYSPRSGGKGRRHKTRRLARFLWFSLSKGHKKNPSCKFSKISTFEPIEFPHSKARGPQSLGFSGSIGRSHRSCLHNYSKNPGGVADFQGIDLCDFRFCNIRTFEPS